MTPVRPSMSFEINTLSDFDGEAATAAGAGASIAIATIHIVAFAAAMSSALARRRLFMRLGLLAFEPQTVVLISEALFDRGMIWQLIEGPFRYAIALDAVDNRVQHLHVWNL